MIKNMPGAVIDIPQGMKDFLDQHPTIEVIIKQDDKVIYHNRAYAVIMNMVQSATDLDPETLEMEGDSQVVGVGHPIIQLFALDQLRKKLHPVLEVAVKMLLMATGHPDLKKKLREIGIKNSIKK